MAENRLRIFAFYAALSALTLFTPLLSQALYLRMGFFAPAVQELLVVSVLAGVLVGFIAAITNRVVRTLLAALLLFYFLDGAIGLRSLLVDTEFPSGIGLFRTEGLLFYSVMASLFGVAWLFFRFGGRIALQSLTYFVVVSCVATVLLHGASAGFSVRTAEVGPSGSFERPIIIQLIADALIAERALPTDIPGSEELSRIIHEFHRKHGFELYTRAYTTSTTTTTSLSRLMNYSLGQPPQETFMSGTRLKMNRHFDRLADWGYRILVYQRDWPSFCGHENVSYCLQFRSRASPGVVERLRGLTGWKQRPLVTLTLIAHPRSILQDVVASVTPLGLMDVPETILNIVGVTQPLESLLAVRTLFEDGARSPAGTALIGHFIIPHFPYSLDASCNNYDGPPHYLTSREPHINTEESRERAYAGYIAQAMCMYRRLDEIFSDPMFSDLLNRATVILHGDHGPGISIGNYAMPETLSDRDRISRYGTHFSVRRPGGRHLVNDRDVSVHRLFYETIDPGVDPWEQEEHEFSTRESLGIPDFR